VVGHSVNPPLSFGSSMMLTLHLSTDVILSAETDAQVATITKRFAAKPGQAKRYTLRFLNNPPAGGPNYQLLAFADATNTIVESRENNNVGAAPITIAPPFVELGTSVGAVRPTAVSGRRFSLPVTLTNNGNVPAKGSATFSIVASTDDVLGNADDVAVTPLTKNINVKNGKTKRVNLAFPLTTLAAGTYRFFVTTVFGGTPADTINTNDTDSADNTVVVS
jgi:hypothetical protein